MTQSTNPSSNVTGPISVQPSVAVPVVPIAVASESTIKTIGEGKPFKKLGASITGLIKQLVTFFCNLFLGNRKSPHNSV